MSYVYLASPYTDPSDEVMAWRHRAVCRVAARLMGEGMVLYSPIAHTHPIAVEGELPRGWEYWQRFDRAMLLHAIKLLVVRMEGWDASKGVAAEIAIAVELGIPVEYIDP